MANFHHENSLHIIIRPVDSSGSAFEVTVCGQTDKFGNAWGLNIDKLRPTLKVIINHLAGGEDG